MVFSVLSPSVALQEGRDIQGISVHFRDEKTGSERLKDLSSITQQASGQASSGTQTLKERWGRVILPRPKANSEGKNVPSNQFDGREICMIYLLIVLL